MKLSAIQRILIILMVVALPGAAIAHGGPDWTTLWTGLGHVVGVTIFLILLIILVRRVMPLNPGNVLGVLVITACMTAMIFIIDQLLYVTLLDPYSTAYLYAAHASNFLLLAGCVVIYKYLKNRNKLRRLAFGILGLTGMIVLFIWLINRDFF